MTKRTLAVPEPPDALTTPPLRFWGERKPPKNRADMFRCVLAAAEQPDSETDEPEATPTGPTATLRLYGPIDSWGGWWGISAKDVSAALDALPADVTEIRVRINSPGGEVWEAMAILNMLRAHRAKVVAVVDGLAASAGSVVAVGCDETVMSPGTQMMIHDASGFAHGPASIMRKAAAFLDSTSNAIASVYAEAAGGTDAEWRALMVEETWYTAQEATDAGLADRVAVIPDAGETETAGGEDQAATPDEVEDAFDLSIYKHAGRTNAPAPAAIASRGTKPPTASAGGSTTTQGTETAMGFTPEQLTTMRQELGLPEDADEATIVAALSEALAERAEDAPADTTPEVPKGHVVIPAAKLADLEAAAQLATATARNLHQKERDAFLDSVRDKYLPTSRAGWEAEYDRDPKGVRAHFEKAPVLIPTNELGRGDEPEADAFNIDDAQLAAFAAGLGLSEEDLRG